MFKVVIMRYVALIWKWHTSACRISYSFNFWVTAKNYKNWMLYKHVRSRKGYLPLWGRWTWEGSVVEDQLWMRRGPLWTRYSVRSLQLFGSVWRTPGDLDPSDHPLYLGPGPTQQPTPAAGVRKIAHMRFKKKKKRYDEGFRETAKTQ